MQDELTKEECNRIYREVEEYLKQKEERIQPSDYDSLSTSDKLLALSYANLVHKRAKNVEEEITKDMKFLENLGIGELKSLNHRVKSIPSILGKVVADSNDYNGSFERAANNICDAVRYTFTINDDIYIQKVDECLHRLEELGYRVIELKNNWHRIDFKGFNVRLLNKDQQYIFEIQFHTPLAYRIKEGKNDETKENSTRNLYLVSKDKWAPAWLRVKADRLRIYLQTFIEVPKGVMEYEYDPDVKRR